MARFILLVCDFCGAESKTEIRTGAELAPSGWAYSFRDDGTKHGGYKTACPKSDCIDLCREEAMTLKTGFVVP